MTRANPSDSAEVFQLVEDCKRAMRAAGNVQWDEIYPSREIVESDAEAGTLWVLRHQGRCLAAMCLDETQSPEYQSVNWPPAAGNVRVVHRLVVGPRWQGKGLGRRMLAFAESQAYEQDCAALRLDVYTGNPRALRLYEAGGYLRVGQVWFPRRPLPFDCFQKTLAGRLVTGGVELLPRIQPLWEALRARHAALSPRFAAEVAAKPFAARLAEWRARARTGELRVEVLARRPAGPEAGYCVVAGQAAEERGELDSLYVEPALRGQGVGSMLVRRALDWLEGKGIEHVSISVLFGNEPALRFYEKHGFYPRGWELRRVAPGTAENFDFDKEG